MLQVTRIFALYLNYTRMSFKLNWGQSIAVFLFLFVIFIGSFVYKTFFVPKYHHALVSKEYYKEEIHFQEEIDRLNLALELEEDVKVTHNSEGITLKFPNNFDYTNIKARVKLIRNSDTRHDIEEAIKLDSLIYFIPDDRLAKGRYTFKLIWEYHEDFYQLNKKIDY